MLLRCIVLSVGDYRTFSLVNKVVLRTPSRPDTNLDVSRPHNRLGPSGVRMQPPKPSDPQLSTDPGDSTWEVLRSTLDDCSVVVSEPLSCRRYPNTPEQSPDCVQTTGFKQRYRCKFPIFCQKLRTTFFDVSRQRFSYPPNTLSLILTSVTTTVRWRSTILLYINHVG